MSVTPENLTDPFVCAVFEDNIVRTRVLFDTLNPRFLPFATRAFIFNINHPGSTLFLGVFDYDEDIAVTDYHDPIGRVVINTMNFESGTNYLLHYDLIDSAQMDTVRCPYLSFVFHFLNTTTSVSVLHSLTLLDSDRLAERYYYHSPSH